MKGCTSEIGRNFSNGEDLKIWFDFRFSIPSRRKIKVKVDPKPGDFTCIGARVSVTRHPLSRSRISSTQSAHTHPPTHTHTAASMVFKLTVKSTTGDKVELDVESLDMKVRAPDV